MCRYSCRHSSGKFYQVYRKERSREASKILVKSAKSKIPQDFGSFYQTMITKKKMIEPIFDCIDF